MRKSSFSRALIEADRGGVGSRTDWKRPATPPRQHGPEAVRAACGRRIPLDAPPPKVARWTDRAATTPAPATAARRIGRVVPRASGGSRCTTVRRIGRPTRTVGASVWVGSRAARDTPDSASSEQQVVPPERRRPLARPRRDGSERLRPEALPAAMPRFEHQGGDPPPAPDSAPQVGAAQPRRPVMSGDAVATSARPRIEAAAPESAPARLRADSLIGDPPWRRQPVPSRRAGLDKLAAPPRATVRRPRPPARSRP